MDELTVVVDNNIGELVSALEAKADSILIKGELCKQIYNLAKKQLSVNGTEYAGLDSLQGVRNMGVAFPIVLSILDLFDKKDTEQEKQELLIEKRLRLYNLLKLHEDEIFLQLKQNDF